MDGRTREARLLRDFRAELTAHVGGRPSATQGALIQQAAMLQLHVATMDRKAAKTGDCLSERDGRQYLAWANALSRLLRQLGMKGAAGEPGGSFGRAAHRCMTATLSAAALQRHAERARLDNDDRLDGCDGPHVFALLHPSGGFGVRKSRWRCTLCSGTVDGLARRWYEAGLLDGARKAART